MELRLWQWLASPAWLMAALADRIAAFPADLPQTMPRPLS